MLLEYNYDSATDILELLKQNQIASLQLKEKDGTVAIEYRLISEFPQSVQAKAQQVLSEALNDRLYLVKLWNDFFISKAAGCDVHLTIKFSAVYVEELQFTHRLVGNLIYSVPENTEYEKLQHCLSTLEETMTHMGIHGQQLVNVYRKEGSGRSKKHIPMTLGDLIFYVRKAVEK